MGQKVNPIGFRVTVNKNWDSRWFAKKETFGLWLNEDIKIREHIKKIYQGAAISKILIERSANRIRLTIFTARPGILVGPKGAELEKMKQTLSKLVKSKDIIVDVKEIKRAETNAQLVAEGIAFQLERRVSFRRAMKKAIQTAMSMGVDGIKIAVAGRLAGSELARDEEYREGRVPLHTLKALIDYGFAEANTVAGKIGVKVWICHKEPVEGMNYAVNAKKSKVQEVSAR